MRRRLYFMLPDVPNAHRMMNEMLLERIEARYIHFLAKPGTALGDLPLATISQRSDMFHSSEIGIGIGAAIGLLGGMLAVMFPGWFGPVSLLVIPITAVIGAIAGAWWMAMVASAIPNTMLKQFEPQLAQGKVLMMVSVPFDKTEEIRQRVGMIHPEAAYGGTWPTDHVVFP